MVIYDEVKNNIKIAVLNNSNEVLEEVKEELENEGFNYEIYEDFEKLKTKVIKNKIKVVVLLKFDEKIIEDLGESVSIIVIDSSETLEYKKLKRMNILNIVPVARLENELNYALRSVAQAEKIDYQKFKLFVVGNLVESISHQIQSNLLLVGASLDVIKMVAEDDKLSKNKEKQEVLNNLYEKNDTSIQKSNLLLELMSQATNVSAESVMLSEEICELIKIILDEYIKESQIQFNIKVKLKKGAYICGPLNDIIFIICKIVTEIIDYKLKLANIFIWEDAQNWYFDIVSNDTLENKERIVNIARYIAYIKGAKAKIKDNKFTIYIKKVK